MSISSRTPEGEPNVCPICGHDFAIEPSLDTLDGCCPCCGALVWSAPPRPNREDPIYGDPMAVRDRVFARAIDKFGWPITSGTWFVGLLPNDDGSRWFAAVEKARTWKEFVLLLESEA